ncbi:MAG: BamA/TamA family outer membrane protein [Myxococcales bacterium]|nr:BamA/TamA family outer membrane protein [Myxococcales bacterium]
MALPSAATALSTFLNMITDFARDRVGGLRPWSSLLVGVLLWVTVGCNGLVRFGRHRPPPGRDIVVQVGVSGNVAVPTERLVERLATWYDNFGSLTNKPLLDRGVLEPDCRRLESVYAKHGYFEARCLGSRVERVDKVSVRVFFDVTEGEPTRIRGITSEGLAPPVDADEDTRTRLVEIRAKLLELLPYRDGEVWTEDGWRLGRDSLRDALRARGFLHAEVESTVLVDRKARTAAVDLVAIPGPLARIKEVKVLGQQEVDEARILRRVDLVPGEVVDPERLALAERDISSLGVFYSVSVQPVRETLEKRLGEVPRSVESLKAIAWPSAVDVAIRVQEMPMHELRAGGGVLLDGSRSEVRATVGFQHRNLFGGLRYFDITLSPAWIVKPSFFDPETQGVGGETRIEFRQPSLFEEWITWSLETRYSLDIELSYRTHGILVGTALSRPIYGPLSARLGYSLEVEIAFDLDPGLRDAYLELGVDLEDPYLLGRLEQTLALDWRDDLSDPRNGVYAVTTVAESLPALGSDFSFISVDLDVRGYWSPWTWLTLAGRASWTRGFPIMGDEDLPPAALFKGGGPSDVRGVPSNQLGPVLCLDDATSDYVLGSRGTCPSGTSFVDIPGGEVRAIFNAELRFHLPWSLGLVAFFDAGQVWSTPEEVNFSTLELTVGPGLRYYSIIGPIRADFGILVTRPDDVELSFHLSLGHAF